MLYPICPTCGSLLANVQLPYQHDMEELCIKYNVSQETMSKGEILKNADFIREKETIVNKYVDRMCCKIKLTTFSDLVRLIN